MSKEENLANVSAISQLIKLNKGIKELKELLTIMVLQSIEMNKITKKLTYISGGSDTVTKAEIEEEFRYLMNHVECFGDKVKEVTKFQALPEKIDKDKKWGR